MVTPAELPLADTSDMIGFHRIFREALAAAPTFVGTAKADDAARADVVGSYYANVLALLDGHHTAEDVLMTPRLLERVPESAETISRIGDQHQVVLQALTEAETAVDQWRSSTSAQTRDAAVRALTALQDALIPHLDEEEREVLPIAATCLNVAEWGEIPAHGMKSFAGDKLWLVIGLVREQMTEQQKAAQEANMPPPLLEFWNGEGRRLFEAFIADVRRS